MKIMQEQINIIEDLEKYTKTENLGVSINGEKELKKDIVTILNLVKELYENNNRYEKELCETIKYSVSREKIKNKIEELSNIKGDFATQIAVSERIKVLLELLENEEK